MTKIRRWQHCAPLAGMSQLTDLYNLCCCSPLPLYDPGVPKPQCREPECTKSLCGRVCCLWKASGCVGRAYSSLSPRVDMEMVGFKGGALLQVRPALRKQRLVMTADSKHGFAAYISDSRDAFRVRESSCEAKHDGVTSHEDCGSDLYTGSQVSLSSQWQ